MRRYVVERVLWLGFVLFGVSVLVFALIRLVPGDIVDILFQADVGGSYVNTDKMREFFGLDQPAWVQYQRWMFDIVRGDLGTSFRSGQPVASEIATRIPVTLEMVVLGMVFALITGIPGGVIAAIRRNSLLDSVLRPLSIMGLSIPSFWLGTLLLLMLSISLPGVSFLGYVSFFEDPIRNLQVMLLPSIALGLVSGAGIMRMTRATLLEVLNQDYLRTARAKGLAERVVIVRHALRNSFIPVLTLLGVQVGVLIGGSVVLEEVFALPGMGRLIVTAIKQRDYPVVQGVALVIAVGFTLINLVTDIMYAYLDPRIKYG